MKLFNPYKKHSGQPNQPKIALGLVTILALCLQLCLSLFLVAPTPAQAQSSLNLTAKAAIAVDAGSGRILFSKDMHRKLAMASTTKIMTALTAFSIQGVQFGEVYTAVQADLVGEASMGLQVGDRVTFEDLLYGLFLNSGNDAAVAIARYAGSKLPGNEDPVAKFVSRMNLFAAELGMQDSRYSNPHGLDAANHYSSAYDLAIAGWYALKNPTISRIMATPTATVAGKNLVSLNPLLKRRPYAGANGIKPGYTGNAGLCLVGSATRNGQTVISVTLGNSDQAYQTEPTALLDFGFEQLKNPSMLEAIKQGATDPALYIGRPDGARLIPFGPAGLMSAPSAAVPAVSSSKPVVGGVLVPIIQQYQQVIESQILTTQVGDQVLGGTNSQAFQNVTTISQFGTPNPTQNANTSSNSAGSGSDNSGNRQQQGGFNFFGLLLFILIAVGVFYIIMRFTPAGGDKGRQIAFQMEDAAGATLAFGRHNLQRLWSFVRPDDSHTASHRPERIEQTAARYTQADSRERDHSYDNEINARYSVKPELGRSRPASASRPTSDEFNVPSRQPIDRNQNPLGNFFDDEEPVAASYRNYPQPQNQDDDDDDERDSLEAASQPEVAPPMPPQPLQRYQAGSVAPRQTPATPNPDNNAFAPVVNSPLPTERDRNSYAAYNQSPAASYNSYNPPANPNLTNPVTSEATARAYQREIVPPQPPVTPNPAPVSASGVSDEMLSMQARRAIDYAQAGRLVASTQEFRRVIEQKPLFDFGGLEEFDHMPVLGFKALANAYRDSGKLKYAVLLVEMAIERYPNDLELRNLLRTLRREAGL